MDSRVVRVCVDMGNIEYSAVSQPFPVFFKKGAGLLSKDARKYFGIAKFHQNGTSSVLQVIIGNIDRS